MEKIALDKVADVLDSVANYIDAVEKEATEKETEEASKEKAALEAANKEKENARKKVEDSVMGKVSDEKSKEVLKAASIETLEVVDKLLDKTAFVSDECGKIEPTKKASKTAGALDPIAAFALGN
jgi:hypothetical protein